MYKKVTFNLDLNVFTVIATFICSGILFQIGVLSDCRVRLEKYDFVFFGWAKLQSTDFTKSPPTLRILAILRPRGAVAGVRGVWVVWGTHGGLPLVRVTRYQ